MNICAYCFNESNESTEKPCCQCHQPMVVSKEEFMKQVKLPELNDSRDHWNNLEPKYCTFLSPSGNGAEGKALRLARFDKLITEIQKNEKP